MRDQVQTSEARSAEVDLSTPLRVSASRGPLVRVIAIAMASTPMTLPSPVHAQRGRVAISVPFTITESSTRRVPVGATCSLDITERTAGNFNCRVALTCNGIPVYGDGAGGWGVCRFHPDGSATFADETWHDGDPAVRFSFGPGHPATARAEGDGWALAMTAEVDTIDAAMAASAERARQLAIVRERERAEERAAAMRSVEASLAGLLELQQQIEARTEFDGTWFADAEQRANAMMRDGLRATVAAGDEGRAAENRIHAAFDSIRAARLQRTRDLIQPYGESLIVRARQLTWRDGAAEVDRVKTALEDTQAAAREIDLRPAPDARADSVDLLGPNGLGHWIRQLTILSGEISDISLNLNRWCDIFPERQRYLRESISRTTGAERRDLQAEQSVLQAEIRDAETYLRQHGVRATRAACDARPDGSSPWSGSSGRP